MRRASRERAKSPVADGVGNDAATASDSRRKPRWAIVAAPVLLHLLLASRFVHFTLDDAFISYRYARNLAANFHYTWGKALAFGSGDTGWTSSEAQSFHDLRSNYGPSAGDVTHNVTADVIYDLPRLVNTTPVVRHLLGGWQIAGIINSRTGLPINVTQPSGRSGSRPDYVGGPPTLETARETLQYLNRAAFRPVPESQFGATIRPGNLGRNALRGHGLFNLDFSLGKNFAITEALRLQFRSDCREPLGRHAHLD